MPPTAHGQAGQAAEQANLSPLSFLSPSLSLSLFLSFISLFLSSARALAPLDSFCLCQACLFFSLALHQLRQLILFSSCSFLSLPRSNSIKSRVSVFLSSHLYFPSCNPLSFSACSHSLRDFLGYMYTVVLFSFFSSSLF